MLNEHLYGIYRILSNRFELINESINHNLTKGQENELLLTRLLKEFLPSVYRLDNGIIIDTNGNSSKQTDIIILKNNAFNFTLSTENKIHLLDQVVAAIEVKSVFNRKSLKEALLNISNLKQLKSKQVNEENLLPIGIIFFYSNMKTNKAHNIDNYFNTLKEEVNKFPLNHRPDIIFNLGNSGRYRFCNYPREITNQEYGLSLLSNHSKGIVVHFKEIDNKTVQLLNFTKKVLELEESILITKVEPESKKFNYLIAVDEMMTRDPMSFPTCESFGKIYFIDKYKGFLGFIQLLSNYMNSSNRQEEWKLNDYLGEDFFKGVGYICGKGIEK